MSKLSKRDSTLLLIIGLVVVLGGIFWFYVKPAKADLASTKESVAAADANVQQLTAQLANLTKNATKPSTVPLVDELRLAKAFPYSEEIPAMILQIEALAKATRVTLGQLEPTTGTDYAGVTGTPFSLDVTGSYFAVQDFLYRMHNWVSADGKGTLKVNGRLAAVTKADLKPADGASDAGTSTSTATLSGKVSANISIVAFSRTVGGATSSGAPADAAAAPATNGGDS